VRLGESDRAIATGMKISRKTAKKYRVWAEELGLTHGPLPAADTLSALLQSSLPDAPPPKAESSIEPYRELVVRWRQQGLERQAIWQRLSEDHSFSGSYSAVWRFIEQLEPQTPEATVRVEVKPGAEAQVDFGYAGMMFDPATGKPRRTWVFVMTLSWSRHQYVEFVFDLFLIN